MIGRTLSHFRIVSRLGQGGMGVVYRAEDEKLRRSVAFKVLPPDSVADEERRLRFLREARAAASLSHPNIATIYEVDEAEGIVFIAMELIDGRTVRSVLAGKALPVRDALRFAIEIAEGLAKAHQSRVVHRDLKPENVMITTDGHVKILDFGLAKLLERDELTAEEASRLETISGEMTKQGRILGTAAYMSPEQARGQSVDHRSDLFAFGSVLYEMVTGRAPFHGPTPMDTLSAILERPFTPALQLNPEVPPELERILGKCLEKDPSERYQHTQDLVVDLRRLKRDTDSQPLARPPSSPVITGLTTAPAPGRPKPAASNRARRGRVALLAAGSAVLVAGVAWLGLRLWPSPHPTPTLRERKQRLILSDSGTNEINGVSISPDGKYLAISRTSGLTVRQLETGEIRSLLLPEGQEAHRAVWASDGTKLLVTTLDPTGKVSIWFVPLVTGAPRLLHQGDWHRPLPSPDGTHLAMGMGGNHPGLWVMDPQGESAHKIFALSEGEWNLHFVWAPSNRRIAYLRTRMTPGGTVGIVESRDLEGGSFVPILTDPSLALAFGGGGGLAWLPDGRLLFSMTKRSSNSTDADLCVLHVDPASGKPEGKPERITNWASGRLGVRGATADGKTLLVAREEGQNDVWIGDLEDGGTRLTPRRLTFDSHQDRPAFWMPDSRRIVFSSDRNGSLDLLVQDLNGGEPSPLVVGPEDVSGGGLTPQRDSFFFVEAPPAGAKGLLLKRADLSGGSVESLFTIVGDVQADCPSRSGISCVLTELVGKEATFYEMNPSQGKGRPIAHVTVQSAPWFPWSLSPDGTRVAYLVGTPSGNPLKILTLSSNAIREIPLPGKTNVQTVAWAPDGEHLFGSDQDDSGATHLFRVDLQGNTTNLLESLPGEWFGNPFPSPDGKHLAYQVLHFASDYWLLEGY